MINVSGIDWSKITKAGEIAPPKFAPKGVTTFMQPPKQSVNLKKFIPQVAPKEEYISPYMELNKPISPEQKQVVMALGANIKKGDDLATIRQKFPEIADIGDKSLQALRANIMKGDSPEMIEKKFPELQWIKTKQTDDKYKYNIMNKPTQFLQGLREKAENIDIPVVEPLAKGVLGTAMLGTKGMRDVIQGGAGLLDKGIAGATGTDKVYKSGVAEDVFDVAQGSSNTLASVVAPVSVTALGTVMSALPKPVQQSVGDIFQNIGGFIAKTPGLKQWKESLPPERRAEFDNEVMGGLTALFFGAKNKLNLLKNPKAFVQENILNPQNVFKNIEKNVFNIPGRIKNISASTKGLTKSLGETTLSANRKIQPTIKSKFKDTFGDSIEKFALDNNLVSKDAVSSAKIAENFKIEKLVEKIDKVREFGWTKNDPVYKLVANKAKNYLGEGFASYIGKSLDDFESKDWDLVKQTNPEGYNIYNQLGKFVNADEIRYEQLEALKEVFDYYNPAKIEYDYKGKPVNQGNKDTRFGARSYIDKAIDDKGKELGVDVSKMNDDIRKAHILNQGLLKADARMANHNILGLMDTQIGIIGSLMGGVDVGLGGLLVRKALQSDSFLTSLSKGLYGTKPRTPYNGIGATGRGRTGRISSIIGGAPDFRQKLKALPESTVGEIDTSGVMRVPKKLLPATKLDSGPQVVKLEGQENMPKTLPNTNLPKKMPTEGIQTAEVPKMLNKGLQVKEIMGRIKAKKLPDGKYKLVYIGTSNAVEIGGKPITELFDNPKQARGYYEAMWYKSQQPKSPKPQEKQAVLEGEKVGTTKLKQSFKGGVEGVKPNNQLKFNQGDNYEPVRLVVNDKDAMVARYGALNNKMSFQRKGSGITDNEKIEMKDIERDLNMLPGDILKRHQFLKDEAKKARSATKEVVIEIKDNFREQANKKGLPVKQAISEIPTGYKGYNLQQVDGKVVVSTSKGAKRGMFSTLQEAKAFIDKLTK